MPEFSHDQRPQNVQRNSFQNHASKSFPVTPAVLQRRKLQEAIKQKKEAEHAAFLGGQQAKTQSPPADGLPVDVQAKMETALGADFSSVKIHQNSGSATDLGALAYTQGEEIHFAPGQFDAQSVQGQSLIGHELTHVVQQRAGRVQPTRQMKGGNINDDPELEREADEMGQKAAAGQVHVMGLGGEDTPPPTTDVATIQGSGLHPDADEQEDYVGLEAEGIPDNAPIQRKPDPKNPTVPVQITFTGTLDQEGFKQATMKQLFGGPVSGLIWTLYQDKYTSPTTIHVAVSLLKSNRGKTNAGKGIATDSDGGVTGSKKLRSDFQNLPEGTDKGGIMTEIDRRYYEASGDRPGTKLGNGPEDAGKRELWKQIQDEVLFQNEFIRNLPPEVKKIIKFTTEGKPITQADIDKLFVVAKKLADMDPALLQDYISKVSGTTTDLDQFGATVEAFLKEATQRVQDNKARIDIQDKLAGNDDVYELYKEWKKPYRPSFPRKDEFGVVDPNWQREVDDVKASRESALIAALQKKGFGSIAEFEKYIHDFEDGFRKEAVRIVLDILGRYEGLLYQEGERYKNPAELKVLYDSLAGFRVKNTEAARLNGIAQETSRQENPGNLPNSHYDRAKGEQYTALAATALEGAKSEIGALKPKHPLLGEDHLPVDRRINKEALTRADINTIGPLIQDHIAARIKDVKEARAKLLDDPDMVFEMPKLKDQFYEAQGIVVGGVSHKIIEDKIDAIRSRKSFIAILLGILAIALAIVSFGTAVPWIAAAAATGGLVLSSYAVIDEYHKYAVQKDLADVGLADDPSMFWLIVAVVGAGLDMGAAVKAVRALGPAAKAVGSATGTIEEFKTAVQLLEKQGEIDSKVARAVESAASSRKAFTEATQELASAMAGKAYGFPGPLADPEVYKALFKMARAKVSEVGSTFEVWLQQLNKMRIDAKLAKLSEPEVEIARAAWLEAKANAGFFANLDEAVKTIKTNIAARIADLPEFALKYTDAEIKAILQKGNALKMTPKEVEEFIFNGSRVKKAASAEDLVQQMDNFTTIVSKRGFPYLFDDAAKFDAFKSDVKALLDKYKIPSSNVKVQGSSLRTASAADVDIAVLVSQQEFDALVAAARQGIRTRNAAKPHLIQSLMDQLDAQVAKGRLGATMFDRISGNSKTFGQELYEFKRHLNDPAKGFDLSLILDTGSFNVSPYLSF